jgi:hypothetical protein
VAKNATRAPHPGTPLSPFFAISTSATPATHGPQSEQRPESRRVQSYASSPTPWRQNAATAIARGTACQEEQRHHLDDPGDRRQRRQPTQQIADPKTVGVDGGELRE